MPVFAARPAGDGPFPVVVIYMDFWGAREELFGIARQVSANGYLCLVPDFYYRQASVRPVVRDENGKVVSLKKLDEKTLHEVLAPLRALSDDMVIRDTEALLQFLQHDDSAKPGAMGCIGYCLGGRLVLKVAAAFPDRFRATACIHGNNIVTDKADSAHLLVDRFQGEIYIGFAARDRHSPPPVIELFDRALRAGIARYSFEIHEGADHGYALPDRDIYDQRATARDWEHIFSMFDRQLRDEENL